MSEPKYRDWILETIDSLRSRKARPDLERICRMVRRRHGSDPDRTRSELEKLIQEQTVLKVSYKGSISYRNAAKVQRKSRKKSEQAADSGESVEEQTKHANFNNNGDSAHSLTDQEECEDKDPEPAGVGQCRDPDSQTPTSTPEKGEKVLPALASGNSCLSCGATGCAAGSGCGGGVKASAPKDKRLVVPQAGRSGSSPDCNNNGTHDDADGSESSSSQTKGARGGVETLPSPDHEGEKENKTCPSASSGSSSSSSSNSHLLRNNKQQTPPAPPPLLKPKLRAGANKGVGPDPASVDLGDRLVAAVRSLSERTSRGHTPPQLGLKEILGYLSTQGGFVGLSEKLTRNRVKVVLEREVARGRLRRTRVGHITLPLARGVGAQPPKPSARLLKSALQDGHLLPKKEVEEEEEPMQMESGEEEDENMEEEAGGTGEGDPQASSTARGQTGVTGRSEAPHTEANPSDDITEQTKSRERKPQPSSSTPSSSSSSTHTAVIQEVGTHSDEGGAGPLARVICPSVQRLLATGSEVVRVEESAVTPDQLQTPSQDQVVVVSEGGSLTSSIPSKSCLGCKMEVGVSSCLLTPTASPRDTCAAEERGMNGGVFVKAEGSSLNPVEWTVADVAGYFTAVGFPEQALAFRTQEIDGKSLLLMQRNDVLTGLSIRLGPALKIYERHVKVLQRTHFQDDGAFC